MLPRGIAQMAVVASATALFVVSLHAAQPSQDASGKRSIWSGVYTDAQAERGHVQYLQACSTCHGDDLHGDSAEEIPSLASDHFLDGWKGRTVKDLVETMRRTMPGNSPGSLSPQGYVDLAAFILRSNGLPSGQQPLAIDLTSLEGILFENAKP